ncbi:MAG: biotin synthase BioB [Sedimentisphaerales bacterium]|nr:biotin synthase BioB [Sedimentisphaerales bacterium]
MLNTIIESAIAGVGCSKEQALALLAQCSLAQLCEAASSVRQHYFGNKVQLCMIVNAKSGVCDMDCRFCCQSAHNHGNSPVYPFLEPEQLNSLLAQMSGIAHNGGVVTSGGRLTNADLDSFIAALAEFPGKDQLKVCASFGRLEQADLARLFGAGVGRYHHNLETSSAYYPQVCTTQQWAERYDTVRRALAAGMQVCSGGLFGLGEGWADRIELALTLRELGVDSIPVNFLFPHAGTPLARQPLLDPDDALTIIAIFRLLLPDRTIRICGGRQKVLSTKQDLIFAAGANALMTGDYLTTAGTSWQSDQQMIKDAGMEVQE